MSSVEKSFSYNSFFLDFSWFSIWFFVEFLFLKTKFNSFTKDGYSIFISLTNFSLQSHWIQDFILLSISLYFFDKFPFCVNLFFNFFGQEIDSICSFNWEKFQQYLLILFYWINYSSSLDKISLYLFLRNKLNL